MLTETGFKEELNRGSITELRSCVSERRGGRPWLSVPNSPYGLCGRQATLKQRNTKGPIDRNEREERERGGAAVFHSRLTFDVKLQALVYDILPLWTDNSLRLECGPFCDQQSVSVTCLCGTEQSLTWLLY